MLKRIADRAKIIIRVTIETSSGIVILLWLYAFDDTEVSIKKSLSAAATYKCGYYSMGYLCFYII